MQIQTLYYLEITPKDIQASEEQRNSSRSRTCPISQAMNRILGEEITLTAANWTGFRNSSTQKWIEFRGHCNCIKKFILNADNYKAIPTILLLERVPF